MAGCLNDCRTCTRRRRRQCEIRLCDAAVQQDRDDGSPVAIGRQHPIEQSFSVSVQVSLFFSSSPSLPLSLLPSPLLPSLILPLSSSTPLSLITVWAASGGPENIPGRGDLRKGTDLCLSQSSIPLLDAVARYTLYNHLPNLQPR